MCKCSYYGETNTSKVYSFVVNFFIRRKSLISTGICPGRKLFFYYYGVGPVLNVCRVCRARYIVYKSVILFEHGVGRYLPERKRNRRKNIESALYNVLKCGKCRNSTRAGTRKISQARRSVNKIFYTILLPVVAQSVCRNGR